MWIEVSEDKLEGRNTTVEVGVWGEVGGLWNGNDEYLGKLKQGTLEESLRVHLVQLSHLNGVMIA